MCLCWITCTDEDVSLTIVYSCLVVNLGDRFNERFLSGNVTQLKIFNFNSWICLYRLLDVNEQPILVKEAQPIDEVADPNSGVGFSGLDDGVASDTFKKSSFHSPQDPSFDGLSRTEVPISSPLEVASNTGSQALDISIPCGMYFYLVLSSWI